MLDLFK